MTIWHTIKKFKLRAIKYHEERNDRRKTAKTFGISPNTLNTQINQYRKEGDVTTETRIYRHKISKRDIQDFSKVKPDAYQTAMPTKPKCLNISKQVNRLFTEP